MPARAEPAVTDSDKNVLVKRGDTASELVQGHMDETVNLNQMLIALLNKNPDAFVDSNVNRLKAGAKLVMPEVQEAQKISKADARQQVKLQVEAFEAYKAALKGKLNKVDQDPAKPSASGDLVKQTDPKGPPQDKLKLNQADKAAADQKAAQQNAKQDDKALADAKKNLDDLKQLADQASNAAGTAGANPANASESSAPAAPAAPADAAAAPADSGVPSAQAGAEESVLEVLYKQPSLYYIGAGVLVLLVLFALSARSRANRFKADEQAGSTELTPVSGQGLGLPPGFNLDLTPTGSDPNGSTGLGDPSHSSTSGELTAFGANDGLPSEGVEGAPALTSFDHAADSLSLGSDEEEDPHLVRLKLASELWELGQVHTSRALAQEVLEQGDPAAQDAARRWLQERS